jgi:hypothetical protein
VTGSLGSHEARIPKAHLVTRLQALLDASQIEFPDTPEAQPLRDELESFQITRTVRGIRAEGEAGVHDDLVTALALSTFFDPHERRVLVGRNPLWD